MWIARVLRLVNKQGMDTSDKIFQKLTGVEMIKIGYFDQQVLLRWP
jgi:hypothetical protein